MQKAESISLPRQQTSDEYQHESHGKSNTFCDHSHSLNLLCSCFSQATLAGCCCFLPHHPPPPLHFPDGKHLPYNINKHHQSLICKQAINQSNIVLRIYVPEREKQKKCCQKQNLGKRCKFKSIHQGQN